jgi:competence protein ComEA
LLVALLVVLALVGKRLAAHGAATSVQPARLAATGQGSAHQAPAARIVVDVVGAVRRGGLYRLPEGARVADAVARAGGPTAKADIALVNLAAPLADGEQVVVPLRVPGGGAVAVSPAGSSPGVSSGPVSLSSATVEQLDALPGIGPVTAQKILDYRTEHGAFHSLEELDAISGIGPAKLDELQGLVVP